MVRRDYIEKLIEQAAQALRQIAQFVAAGEFDPALQMIRRTGDLVLGPLAPLLDRLDANSAVALAGRFELDRIRMYAALTAEEGDIHQLRGHVDAARRCHSRALELYAAAARAGARLLPADEERIARLSSPGLHKPSLDSNEAGMGS